MALFKRKKKGNKRVKRRPKLYRMRHGVLDKIKLTLWVCAIASALVLGYRSLNQTSYFDLKKLTISGSFTHLTQDEILKLAQIPANRNIFAINLYKIGQNLKRYSWVDKVQVRRHIPDQISIYLKEHTPFVILKTLDKYALTKKSEKNEKFHSHASYYYVNEEGEIFKKVGPTEDKNFPMLSGFSEGDLRKYPNYLGSKFKDAFGFLKAFMLDKANENYKVKELEFSLSQGVTLSVENAELSGELTHPLKIYFGNKNWILGLSQWLKFKEVMESEKSWFQSIDVHVPHKVFAQVLEH